MPLKPMFAGSVYFMNHANNPINQPSVPVAILQLAPVSNGAVFTERTFRKAVTPSTEIVSSSCLRDARVGFSPVCKSSKFAVTLCSSHGFALGSFGLLLYGKQHHATAVSPSAVVVVALWWVFPASFIAC